MMMKNNYFTYFTTKYASSSIIGFVVALLICCVVFADHVWLPYLFIMGFVSVIGFFYGSHMFSRRWGKLTSVRFQRKTFMWTLFIRLACSISMYYLYLLIYDNPYGPEGIDTDASWYVPQAMDCAQMIKDGINPLEQLMNWNIDISDIGYILYLSVIYLVTGGVSDFIIPFILKSIYGAITCVEIYKISTRHFDESIARLAAIFCMLCPNLIWWCGCMMKETEMILLTVIFIEQSDLLLINRSWSIKSLIPIFLSGFALFGFRTVLGITVFLSLLVAVLFSSTRVIGYGKRIGLAVIVAVMIGLGMGENIKNSVKVVFDTDVQSQQQENMEWRTRRLDKQGKNVGNQFAKYAGAAVFAPLIFTIPFPTLSYTYKQQEWIMQNAGGNYVKNVTSFFVILALLYLLFSGDWRKHVLLIAILCGYLLVLVMSTFAQSGRFHMPVVPFEMMFAAMGFSIVYQGVPFSNKIGRKINYRKYFILFIMFEVVACVGWQYIKLKGQGRL